MKLISNFLYLYRQYISERSVLSTGTISNLVKTTLTYLETLIHPFYRGVYLNFIKLKFVAPPQLKASSVILKDSQKYLSFYSNLSPDRS